MIYIQNHFQTTESGTSLPEVQLLLRLYISPRRVTISLGTTSAGTFPLIITEFTSLTTVTYFGQGGGPTIGARTNQTTEREQRRNSYPGGCSRRLQRLHTHLSQGNSTTTHAIIIPRRDLYAIYR